MELTAIEILQNKRRWLFIGIYKPPSQSDNEFTNRLSLIIDSYLPKYENLILIGDFNLSTENQHLDALIQAYNLNNLLTNQHVSSLINLHALTLYLPIRKTYSNYPILLRLVVEENNIISDEEEIANIMNNYFINVTKTLNLKKQLGVRCSGINEFENHISIKMIHEKYRETIAESFKFQLVSNNEVKTEIENLDTKKSSTYDSTPAIILKQCVNAYLLHLTNSINYSIQHSSFLQELKLSEVIPVYKKLNPLQKENYRPVRILPHVSKVFERIIH